MRSLLIFLSRSSDMKYLAEIHSSAQSLHWKLNKSTCPNCSPVIKAAQSSLWMSPHTVPSMAFPLKAHVLLALGVTLRERRRPRTISQLTNTKGRDSIRL